MTTTHSPSDAVEPAVPGLPMQRRREIRAIAKLVRRHPRIAADQTRGMVMGGIRLHIAVTALAKQNDARQ